MKHEDETERRPAPETPQSVWQSLHQEEETGMEMSLTPDQLCARARYREKENIWFRWIALVACVGLGAPFVYWAVRMPQIWFRLARADTDTTQQGGCQQHDQPARCQAEP